MEEVFLKPLEHNGQECIGIYFERSSRINGIIKKQAGARWSHTKKIWHVPLSRQHYDELMTALRDNALVDHSALREYLTGKKKQASGTGNSIPGGQQVMPAGLTRQTPTVLRPGKLHPVNAHVLPAMEQYLKLKAYSPSTIKTYLGEMLQLLVLLNGIPADELTDVHIKRYMVYCSEKLRLTENTLHSRINALKFYYEQVLKKEKFFWEIPRPKKPFLLPKLLNEAEIRRLFNSLENKKHKAMLFTAYSAGLRVSEIVNLKIADIDSSRMQIFIERAKGKKDRYVNLSPVLLDILRNYVQLFKPVKYLFESGTAGHPYPIRTVQQVFSNAKHRAGIKKAVGIHSLRHSFATHLLDKGTDIKYIKEILGHFSIKTTERYLHVSKQQLVNIISPFDDLWGNERLDW